MSWFADVKCWKELKAVPVTHVVVQMTCMLLEGLGCHADLCLEEHVVRKDREDGSLSLTTVHHLKTLIVDWLFKTL